MCLVFSIINLPYFPILVTVLDLPLWSLLLASSMTPCIQGPSSSCSMTTVDPMGKECESLYHCP